jgi:pimeloyl-ACP methyl ester carboxylesterase
MRRAFLGVAVSVAFVLAPAAPASAALDFQPCAEPAGVQCATIDVPVDRTGHVPGTFTLLVHRVPAPHPAGRPPLVFLAGGPGQTNTDLTPAAIQRFGGALDDRDLIVFSQRGTGPSAIHCAALEAGAAAAMAMPACAQQLGPARSFYTSRDAADDLDDIRQALGVDKVAIVTASYGTWVAQGYAIRHPQHVERIVLDSTYGPNQNADPFSVEQFSSTPALARALCHRGGCDGITTDPYGDLVKLFAKLTAKPIAARVVAPNGRRRKVKIGPFAVAQLLPQLDVDTNLRAELPRAVTGALNGRPGVLGRLVFGGPVGPPPDPRGATNQTLFNVTHCEEDVHPFDRTAKPADRIAQARDNLAAIPPATFDPFGPQIALLTSFVPTCAFWNMRAQQPSFGSGSPPNIPVLLIHGEFDLRSTLQSTETVASEYRQGKILVVPNEGHSPTRTPTGGCARAAAVVYIRDGFPPRACPVVADPFAPRALVPPSVKQAGGPIVAAQLTVADAFHQLDAGSLLRVDAEPFVKGGGLRAGRFNGSKRGLVLRGYTFVPGFPVIGLVKPTGTVVLKIRRGVLRFAEDGTVTGKLRGKEIVPQGATLQRRSFAQELAAAPAGD